VARIRSHGPLPNAWLPLHRVATVVAAGRSGSGRSSTPDRAHTSLRGGRGASRRPGLGAWSQRNHAPPRPAPALLPSPDPHRPAGAAGTSAFVMRRRASHDRFGDDPAVRRRDGPDRARDVRSVAIALARHGAGSEAKAIPVLLCFPRVPRLPVPAPGCPRDHGCRAGRSACRLVTCCALRPAAVTSARLPLGARRGAVCVRLPRGRRSGSLARRVARRAIRFTAGRSCERLRSSTRLRSGSSSFTGSGCA
jgi:hypothetical protein